MILSQWLAALLGGSLAVQGALAIDLNVDDEGQFSFFSPFCDRHCGHDLT